MVGLAVSSMIMADLPLVSKKENSASVGSSSFCPPLSRQSRLHPWRQNPGPHEPRSCILWDIAPCGEISDNACCTRIQTNLNLGLTCRYLDRCRCQLGSLEGSSGSCVGTMYPWPSQKPCMLQSQCTPGCAPPEVADHSLLLRPWSWLPVDCPWLEETLPSWQSAHLRSSWKSLEGRNPSLPSRFYSCPMNLQRSKSTEAHIVGTSILWAVLPSSAEETCSFVQILEIRPLRPTGWGDACPDTSVLPPGALP